MAKRRKLQEPFSSERVWSDLVNWITSSGGYVGKLTLASNDEGLRGIHAAADLSVGEVIIRVPWKCCITADTVRASPAGRAAKLALEKIGDKALSSRTPGSTPSLYHSPKDLALAVHVAWAGLSNAPDINNNISSHTPYWHSLPPIWGGELSMLPRRWPVGWTEDLLKGSPLLDEVQEQRTGVEADWSILRDFWPTMAEHRVGCNSDSNGAAFLTLPPTLESFDWALAIISSRAFAFSPMAGEEECVSGPSSVGGGGGGDDAECLVPLLDLLNHRRPRETGYGREGGDDDGGGSSLLGKSAEGEEEAKGEGREGPAAAASSPPPSFGSGGGSGGGGGGGVLAVVSRALRPVGRGRAVHETYGARGAADLLKAYGFAAPHRANAEPDGSSNERLPLRVPPPPPPGAAAAAKASGAGTTVMLRVGPKRYTFGPFAEALGLLRRQCGGGGGKEGDELSQGEQRGGEESGTKKEDAAVSTSCLAAEKAAALEKLRAASAMGVDFFGEKGNRKYGDEQANPRGLPCDPTAGISAADFFGSEEDEEAGDKVSDEEDDMMWGGKAEDGEEGISGAEEEESGNEGADGLEWGAPKELSEDEEEELLREEAEPLERFIALLDERLAGYDTPWPPAPPAPGGGAYGGGGEGAAAAAAAEAARLWAAAAAAARHAVRAEVWVLRFHRAAAGLCRRLLAPGAGRAARRAAAARVVARAAAAATGGGDALEDLAWPGERVPRRARRQPGEEAREGVGGGDPGAAAEAEGPSGEPAAAAWAGDRGEAAPVALTPMDIGHAAELAVAYIKIRCGGGVARNLFD